MTSTEKKMMTATTKMLSPTPESTLIPSLPDDLLLSCFARVSTLHYPTISLVSKRFRSLLTSPEFHKTRSFLGRTESRLFVCFRPSPDDRNHGCWFSLCRKPNQTLTNASSGYVLAPIPVPKSPQALSIKSVAIGSNIYIIGGEGSKPSSSVSILDSRSYTWREAPSMHVERVYPKINICDGKIFVSGGCRGCDSTKWMEVFDPKTETWEFVTLSPQVTKRCFVDPRESTTIKGEIVMFWYMYKGVAYKVKEDRWEEMIEDNEMGEELERHFSCVIDDVLYCLYTLVNEIKWYDSKRKCRMDVKGLDSLGEVQGYQFKRMINYGGKILVIWDWELYPHCDDDGTESVVWCVVIAVERRNEDEIWGIIEWFDGLLTIPESYQFISVVTPTV